MSNMAKVVSYLVVASFATFFTCVTASTIRHTRGNNRSPFAVHMERVNAFTCSEPQLKVVSLEELGIVIASDESYYPSSTVLKRCSCTGYCSSRDFSCTASHIETVELVFKVIKFVNDSNSSEFRTFNATHETACSCQATKQIK